MIAEIEWDSSTTAGVIQAVATIVAVVVGYSLSLLAERRERKRAQQAAATERRITTLVDLLEALDDLGAGVRRIHSALEPIADLGSESGTAAARREAALDAARRASEHALAATEEAHRRTARHALRARVLAYNDELQVDIERSRELADRAAATIELALSGQLNHLAGLQAVDRELAEVMRTLLDEGRGLT